LFRLRCYSESNLDEYGWKSMGSSSLSQTRIMEVEEGEEEEGHREADIRFFKRLYRSLRSPDPRDSEFTSTKQKSLRKNLIRSGAVLRIRASDYESGSGSGSCYFRH
jgi:hypothetical protein